LLSSSFVIRKKKKKNRKRKKEHEPMAREELDLPQNIGCSNLPPFVPPNSFEDALPDA
jgi:hypothetical protein